MPWTLMPLEEAYKVLESGPCRKPSLSAMQARRRREAELVMLGQLAQDEIRAVLEAEFGPLD